MSRVSEVTGLSLSKTDSPDPNDGEWSICYRAGGELAQQIVVKLPDEQALKSMIMLTNGCGIRVNGRNLVVEVRTIDHPSSAGVDARNFVPRGGGSCL